MHWLVVDGASVLRLRPNRSRLAPPSRVVSEEKGWWEGEDSPEEEVEDSAKQRWAAKVFEAMVNSAFVVIMVILWVWF